MRSCSNMLVKDVGGGVGWGWVGGLGRGVQARRGGTIGSELTEGALVGAELLQGWQPPLQRCHA